MFINLWYTLFFLKGARGKFIKSQTIKFWKQSYHLNEKRIIIIIEISNTPWVRYQINLKYSNKI